MNLIVGRLAAVVAGLLLAAATATAQDRVLRESEVTPEAIISSLAPQAEVGAARSIVPRPDSQAAPRKASVLVTFEANSTLLTSSAKLSLEQIGKALKSDQLASSHIVVEGHADPRGKKEWNQRLSELRAQAVKQFLIGDVGVPAAKLDTVGKGDAEPMNAAVPAAPENRRVTFVASQR